MGKSTAVTLNLTREPCSTCIGSCERDATGGDFEEAECDDGERVSSLNNI